MKKIYLLILFSFCAGIICGQEKSKSLFVQDKAAVKNFNCYRAYLNKKSGAVSVPVEGVLLTKKIYGPGIYSVTFAVDESHKKFKYHKQSFVFYFTPPVQNEDELKSKMTQGAEYLYLIWRKSGQVEFYKHISSGKTQRLGIWIKPGPDKDNAYKKDTFVTMNIVVPKPGGDLKVYFNKPPQGEAECVFQMPESPAKGQFGFYNPKWYSLIEVKDLQYKGK